MQLAQTWGVDFTGTMVDPAKLVELNNHNTVWALMLRVHPLLVNVITTFSNLYLQTVHSYFAKRPVIKISQLDEIEQIKATWEW